MNPAKAMIWKELRQNLKWAGLGLLAMAVGVAYLLWEHRGGSGYYSTGSYARPGTPLLDDDFQGVTASIAAAVAIMIALAQVLGEKRLDQWAFLTHRPVSRTQLFLYKIVAGLMLYALAVGLPFAAAVAWVATRVPAPFSAGMTLPGLTDLLGGVAFYFGGLLIGLREARWYGSRIVVAALAVLASIATFVVPDFGWAILIIVIAVAVLAVAAWGCFLAGGHYDRQPRLAKATLGFAVFAGIVLLGGVGVGVLLELIPKAPGNWESTDYVLDANGHVLRVKRRSTGVAGTTDLAGNPVPHAVKDGQLFIALGANDGDVSLWLDDRDWHDRWRQTYRREGRFFANLYSRERVTWYYVQAARHFVGYDPTTAGRVGYLGPAGFSPASEGPPAQRFDSPYHERLWARSRYKMEQSVTLAFPSAIYRIDFDHQQVLPEFTAPPGQRFLSVGDALRDTSADAGAQHDPTPPTQVPPLFTAILTSEAVSVRTFDGQLVFTTPLEHGEADDYASVTVSRRGDPGRYFLRYFPARRKGEAGMRPQQLVELTSAGEVVARHELPAIPLTFTPRDETVESSIIGLTAPPLGLAGMIGFVAFQRDDSLSALLEDRNIRLSLVLSLVSGLVWAAFTFILAGRYDFPPRRRAAWTAANFLLGPAGALTLLSLPAWPALEKCPGCGRRRVVTRESCPKCDAKFAVPVLDGTEIFAT